MFDYIITKKLLSFSDWDRHQRTAFFSVGNPEPLQRFHALVRTEAGSQSDQPPRRCWMLDDFGEIQSILWWYFFRFYVFEGYYRDVSMNDFVGSNAMQHGVSFEIRSHVLLTDFWFEAWDNGHCATCSVWYPVCFCARVDCHASYFRWPTLHSKFWEEPLVWTMDRPLKMLETVGQILSVYTLYYICILYKKYLQ